MLRRQGINAMLPRAHLLDTVQGPVAGDNAGTGRAREN